MRESLAGLMFLVGAYYFLQGMGGNPGLHTQALQKFLKDSLHYNAAQSAAFTFLITVPWMIKPLYGLLSDFFPIFGLRRKSYFILASALAVAGFAAVALRPPTAVTLPLLLFVVGLGVAFSDVLCDAVMVEKGQPLNATDRLQAAQWTSLFAAGVIVAFSKGYIAQYLSLSEAVVLSMIFPTLVIVFTLLMLREERVASSRDSARQAWAGLKLAARSRTLWAAGAFIFLFQCSPNFGSAFYYYEKDQLKFDDVLIGQVDTVGSIGNVVGALLFGALAKRLEYLTLVRIMIIMGVVSGLLYLLFRGVVSAFAVTSVASVISIIPFLGVLTIAAKVCPKYAEGTTFALLMAVSNFGVQAGGVMGGKLYDGLGYSWLVVIGVGFTAVMWLFIPWVRKPVPAMPPPG